MNSDIRLSVGFWQHPKTKKITRRLGLEGVRSLQVLWLWAAQNRPDGNLAGMDWEDIELAADWQGEEHAFFDVCLGMWIDETEEGYSLHDWQGHNPWASEAGIRSGQSRLAKLAQVNREAYEDCVKRGITGLSEEEYLARKRQRTATAEWKKNDRNAATLEAQSSGTVPAKRTLANTTGPSPSPAPAPQDIKTGVCSTRAPDTRCAENRAANPDAEEKAGVDPGSVGKIPPRQPSVAFDQFFDAYPVAHRGGRTEAERKWVTLEHNRALPGINRLLDTLGEWEDSERWKIKDGQYVPSAANFLAREYWLQKPPKAEPFKPVSRDGPSLLSAAERKAQRLAQDGEESYLARMRAREMLNGNTATHGLGIGGIVHALPASLPGQAGA